jgi:hypothetical protein
METAILISVGSAAAAIAAFITALVRVRHERRERARRSLQHELNEQRKRQERDRFKNAGAHRGRETPVSEEPDREERRAHAHA